MKLAIGLAIADGKRGGGGVGFAGEIRPGNPGTSMGSTLIFPVSCTGLVSGTAYNNGLAILPCP